MIKAIILALSLNASLAYAQAPQIPQQVPQAPAMPANVTQGATGAAALAQKANDQATVHLNSATLEDLQKLPGIGPDKAKAIIAARPFKSVTDLKNVKGIKEGVFAKLKGLVSL